MVSVTNVAISSQEWHLLNTFRGALPGALDANVLGAWADYTGRGVVSAIVDDGFAYQHRDLVRNYAATLQYDFRMSDTDAAADRTDKHGTPVAGIVGASWQDGGSTGVSPEATLMGLRIGYGAGGSIGVLAQAIRASADADSMNGSWSFAGSFTDNFNRESMQPVRDALAHAALEGRGGLGTVMVVAAGNSRQGGDSANYHNIQNSPYTIAVGAYGRDGKPADFSSPGASVLVAAPGASLYATDLPGGDGYWTGDHVSFTGTSAAAPVVTGIVNLMLDANPMLGARDVQEILAYSAAPMVHAPGAENDADNWNGGGLLFNQRVGFGAADATAAVRLAETWDAGASFRTMDSTTARWDGAQVIDGPMHQIVFRIAESMRIDRVEVAIDLTHQDLSDLRITLVGPDWTRSLLADRPLLQADPATRPTTLSFTFSSNQFWGEAAAGVWRLQIADVDATGGTGLLRSVELRLHGDRDPVDDTYTYTDALAGMSGERLVLADTDGGIDTLNAAMVTTALALDLRPGAVQTIAGKAVTLDPATLIENAVGGDANDRIIGNTADNIIWGGRGTDMLRGGRGADEFVFGVRSGHDVVWDFAAEDSIVLTGGITLAALEGTRAFLSDGATIRAANGWVWSADDFTARDTMFA